VGQLKITSSGTGPDLAPTLPIRSFRSYSRDDPRKTLRGSGWAWTCGKCKQYASSKTLAGELLCYQHGGTTAKQRDPEARAKARAAGEKLPRPPGRPITHGRYSRGEKLRVDERVASYQAQGPMPEYTGDDLHILRAYFEELMAFRPAPQEVMPKLERFQEQFEQFERSLTEEGVTVAKVMEMVADAREVKQAALACTRALESLLSFTRELEARHQALTKASELRAEMRINNKMT
jgi:hypothetical protein